MPIKLPHGSLEADQIVDPISRAARVTLYNTDGSTQNTETGLTYAAATDGNFAASASLNIPFFTIYGSATKTIKIQRVYLSGFTSTSGGIFNYRT